MVANWFSMLAGIALLFSTQIASAIELNIDDHASIQQAASKVAHGMTSYYKGNEYGQIPGILPKPYYWWEAGAMFGSLIDYWRYTGDSTYNDMTSEAMLWQASSTRDFMPPNQTQSEGNDDQAFWGITALMAAESGFPDPPPDKPQWLALAQGVFNTQAIRWDNSSCGGGLRWQIQLFAPGYNYKNSISQGGFFNLAARLGAFTNNQTYYEWADKMYAWCESVNLISPTFQVFDGTDSLIKCTELNHNLWYVFVPEEDETSMTINLPSQVIQRRHLPPRLSSDVESSMFPYASKQSRRELISTRPQAQPKKSGATAPKVRHPIPHPGNVTY
jgi:mannan endo-1,6-alpha-mannosidase